MMHSAALYTNPLYVQYCSYNHTVALRIHKVGLTEHVKLQFEKAIPLAQF